MIWKILKLMCENKQTQVSLAYKSSKKSNILCPIQWIYRGFLREFERDECVESWVYGYYVSYWNNWHNWHTLWIKSDSSNYHSESSQGGVNSLRSLKYMVNIKQMNLVHLHISKEGSCCTDKLEDYDRDIMNFLWWDNRPYFIKNEFFRSHFIFVYLSICLAARILFQFEKQKWRF